MILQNVVKAEFVQIKPDGSVDFVSKQSNPAVTNLIGRNSHITINLNHQSALSNSRQQPNLASYFLLIMIWRVLF